MNHTVLVVPAGCYPNTCTASSGTINNGISSGASLNFTPHRPWLSPPSCLRVTVPCWNTPRWISRSHAHRFPTGCARSATHFSLDQKVMAKLERKKRSCLWLCLLCSLLWVSLLCPSLAFLLEGGLLNMATLGRQNSGPESRTKRSMSLLLPPLQYFTFRSAPWHWTVFLGFMKLCWFFGKYFLQAGWGIRMVLTT